MEGILHIIVGTLKSPMKYVEIHESLASELTKILNKCWKDQKLPKEWKEGIIIKLPKKGDLADCNNWRGITLLSVTGKVFVTYY